MELYVEIVSSVVPQIDVIKGVAEDYSQREAEITPITRTDEAEAGNAEPHAISDRSKEIEQYMLPKEPNGPSGTTGTAADESDAEREVLAAFAMRDSGNMQGALDALATLSRKSLLLSLSLGVIN